MRPRKIELVGHSDFYPGPENTWMLWILVACSPGFLFHFLIWLGYVLNDNVYDIFYQVLKFFWL